MADSLQGNALVEELGDFDNHFPEGEHDVEHEAFGEVGEVGVTRLDFRPRDAHGNAQHDGIRRNDNARALKNRDGRQNNNRLRYEYEYVPVHDRLLFRVFAQGYGVLNRQMQEQERPACA